MQKGVWELGTGKNFYFALRHCVELAFISTMAPKKDKPFETEMEKAGFTTDTVKTLQEHGFETLDDLPLLSGEANDIQALGLTLAQKLKLRQYVDKAAGPSASAASKTVDVADVLKDLQLHAAQQQQHQQHQQQHVAAATGPAGGALGIADPLVYLRDASGGSKHRDIADYVYLVCPVSEDHVISDEGGVQVLFRTAPKKPKLQLVSIEEWALANTRIMDAMYTAGELVGPALRDYWAYTAKVCELFRLYDRVNVLQYDREYRHMQAQIQHRWGTDAPHLHTVHLKPRIKMAAAAPSFGTPRVQQQSRGGQVCRIYNHNKDGCSYGSSCKYRHVCSEPGCQQAHPRRENHSAGMQSTAGFSNTQ